MIGAVRFDDNFLDELKSRLRLSDVIGRTVKLKRQGREFVGLSPFTKERTPSFFVNDDKGFFHDFSSGKHGDLITFLQETERLSFVEAVERLASEAGLALPEPDPRAAEADKKALGLIDWLEAAAAWFEAELRRPAGREARDYLARRGLPEDQWKRFRLGYAPGGRSGLKDYLIAKGALPQQLIEAGLLIAPDDGGAPYDRFRERIIFPIADGRGRIVSFGGRALDPEAKAKYLNGPETPVFHKGRVLYGLAEARKLMHAAGDDAALVVVEGYMDVIACQRAGVAARGLHGHGADRGADGGALAAASGADPLLRRRPGGPRGGVSGHRPGPASAEARPQLQVRPAAGRQGPGRRAARRGRGGAEDPTGPDHLLFRAAVRARTRRRAPGYARAPGRAETAAAQGRRRHR